MVDIAREIFAASGFDVEYRNYGWARSLSLARENRIDGVIGALKGDAPDFVFPERPMGTARRRKLLVERKPKGMRLNL